MLELKILAHLAHSLKTTITSKPVEFLLAMLYILYKTYNKYAVFPTSVWFKKLFRDLEKLTQ